MPNELVPTKSYKSLEGTKGRLLSKAEKIEELARKVRGQASPSLGLEVALLLDRSGSMWGEPIQKLRECVRDFKGLRRFQYSDTCQELQEGKEIQNPGDRASLEGVDGNNNELVAFEVLKKAGVKHVVFVTDGHPDNPREALKAASGLKIDIIYIGPPPPPPFLQELARATGGRYDGEVSFSRDDGARTLSSKIKGLLPAPSSPEEKKGVIAL